jgi:predicted negative regulator of RcsB-dependent stress response
MQELLAEIAVKYAQTGDLKKAKLIAEALTIETSKKDALFSIDKLPQQAKKSFAIKKITDKQKQQLLDKAKSILDSAPAFQKEEYKVRIALIMSEFGLFKEAENLIGEMKEKVFQAVTLIGIADIYISLNKMDIAQLKLAKAMELALSLECNVSPCSGRPQKPRL